jgi:hypothetical protein
MTPSDRRVEINISGIKVSGVGGLGMVAMAALVSVMMPAAWWTMVLGLTGGVLLAIALIAFRRHHVSHEPSGDDPTILFRSEAGDRVPAVRTHPTDRVQLAAAR